VIFITAIHAMNRVNRPTCTCPGLGHLAMALISYLYRPNYVRINLKPIALMNIKIGLFIYHSQF